MRKQFLEAGQIVSTHGLKGELRIAPWCDSPDFLLQFNSLYFDDKGENFRKIEAARVHKSLVLIKFENIDDINEACKLLRKIVYIDRNLVSLPEGSYFEQDLLGIAVLDFDTGAKYGTLKSVQRAGRQEVYTIANDKGKETMIPVIDDVIKKVDIDNGIILITPLKGLFDDED